MLNSKYAPIIALTVLGIIVVVLLGWFLAVKPQIDTAAAYSADEDLVRSNIATVQTDSAAIAQAGVDAESFVDLEPAIALNAPSRFDVVAVRTRLADTIAEAGMEIGTINQSSSYPVQGWEVPSSLLLSTDLAKRFQSGPAPTIEVAPQEFTPAVAVTGGTVVLADNLIGIPIVLEVVGTADEAHAFLDSLQNPDQPLFQVSEFTLNALDDGTNVGEGISPPSNGDVQLSLSGFLYLSNVDRTIVDEAPLEPAPNTGAGPFSALDSAAPAQPGAN
ncbi:hypothetical protein [Demequina sediminicola]|uniref:hypothetical protein n=1 Tax=Demequina sediminicola TaxID=1095026 RepID=UPI000784D39E|nr:hypothetical protein [Demequina sediminicola]